MFCPFCGVKNDAGLQQCFVCRRKLPSLDAEAPEKTRGRASFRSTSSGPTPARLGDRMIAVVLDTVLIVTLLIPAAAYLIENFPSIDWASFTLVSLAAGVTAAVLLVTFFYYWIQEGAFGATLGKAIIGIRVLSNGTSVSTPFRSAAIRNAFRLVDGVPFYFPGFLVAAFSRRRQRLGDYAAHTLIAEQPIGPFARAAAVAAWLAVISAAIWLTWVIKPDWFRFDLP